MRLKDCYNKNRYFRHDDSDNLKKILLVMVQTPFKIKRIEQLLNTKDY